jgi:DNA-binding FrmR family transcriptional regulator
MGTEELTRRLKLVEGQVRGLQKMVEEQRDCEIIITQLIAARAALDRVGLMIAQGFLRDCLEAPGGAVPPARMGRVIELFFTRFSVPAQEVDPPLATTVDLT